MGQRAGYGFNFSDSSGGGLPGTTTFTGLTDTPDNIVSDQFVRGNSGGDALVFTDISFTDLDDTPNNLQENRFLQVNPAGDRIQHSQGNLATDAQISKLDGIEEGAEVNVQADWDETNTASDAFILNKPTIPEPMTAAFTIQEDGTQEGTDVTTINIGDRLNVDVVGQVATVSADIQGSGTGATSFTDLTDTPAALGTVGQIPAINAAEDAFEFISPTTVTGTTEFTGLTDTPSSIESGQYLIGNSDSDALEFINPLILSGVVDVTGDITITTDNVDQYERMLWVFAGGSHTVTINAGTGLDFFGVYVRQLTNTATIQSVSGTDVSFNNNPSMVQSGRSGNIYFSVTTDRFRSLLTNSVGVTIQDSSIVEGSQVTNLNFGNNLVVEVVDGVARVDSLAEAEQLTEPQRVFLENIVRDPVILDTQQSGFDFDVIANPIDTVNTDPGSDLSDLNLRDTNEFSATTGSGLGFAYLLFQGGLPNIDDWKIVKTNADRSEVELLGDLNDDFTEINVDAAVSLLMSNIRYRYEIGDVIAIYTISGVERIFIEDATGLFDLSNGIPDGSITSDKINFAVSGSLEWRACTLSTTASSTTVATLPGSTALSEFNDITVLWNSGSASPISGTSGNDNRYVCATGSLVPLSQVPTNRGMLISAMGRGADQFSIQIDSALQTDTSVTVRIINLNTETIESTFNITNVWVR